jgi:hypothetical protein
VQVLEYADEAPRQAESKLIWSDGNTFGMSSVLWISKPNLQRNLVQVELRLASPSRSA